MKKKAMRLLAAALSCLLLFGLAACGTSGQSGSTGSGQGSGAAGGETVVTFWHSTSGAEEIALQSIIDSYNQTQGAENNVRVDLVYQGYEGTDKVILAYQNNDTANAPDINQGLTSTIPSMKDLSWTVPVERFLADDPKFKDSLYPHMVRSVTYMDEMVALPFATSTMLLYYNVDALKEAGFDGPPQTIDEMVTYVEALTQKDSSGNITRYGLNAQIKRYQLVNFLASQGSFVGDNEGGRLAPMTQLTCDEDGSLAAFFDKWDQLVGMDGYRFDEDSVNEEFAQGLNAMAIMSSSRIGAVSNLIDGEFEFMTAPIPKVNEDDDWGAAVGGSCLVLFDRGDEARLNAAWDVLKYCASAESQATLSMASGRIPVNTETENLPEMQTYYEENPQYKVSLDSMKASNPMSQEPLDLVYNEVFNLIRDTMLEYCNGNISKEDAMAAIVSGYNSLLDEYHFANG